MTFVWGFVIFFYLPDGPHNAKMLSEYERVVAVWRISRNQTGVKHKKFMAYQVREALLDPKTYLLLLMAACYGILNGGVANFLSTLIKGLGFDALQTSLLQTPGGAFEVVTCIGFGYLATVKNWVGVTIVLACFPGIAGLVGLLRIDISNLWSLVGCCWLQSVLGSPIVLNWTLPVLNVAGHTKRATVIGMYFVVYCGGNIVCPPILCLSKKSSPFLSAFLIHFEDHH